MTPISLDAVLRAVNGKAVNCPDPRGVYFTGVSTDSRAVKAAELFFALVGDKYDAHDFIASVVGIAAGAVVSRMVDCPKEGFVLIVVDDTLKALQRLAAHVRQVRPIPVVALTGTNGKTTTKEMTAAVLGKKYSVLKTEGNLNNHIGLPLTLLRLDNEDAAVLEMGANKQGDIAELCKIAAPDIAIVTNIGPGHLEGFRSIEGVRATKLEIMNYAKTIIVNGDDDFLMEGVLERNKTRNREIITFGKGKDVSCGGHSIRENGSALQVAIRFSNGVEIDATIRSGGMHNVSNALAAAAAGFAMGVDTGSIQQALSSFKGVPMRLECREINGSLVICDYYNANPASMANAVAELIRLKKGTAVAVLGDMLELGEYAERYHRELGRSIPPEDVDLLIAVGELMKFTYEDFRASGGNAVHAVDAVEAGTILRRLKSKDTVLIKGSRGLKMEKVLE
ncbi:MAG: UDP-N-acetylmuramoyl-tripeptide--D-alanyl-D-alanine ligase [Nitrospirae bacterium]|nr:UDP-N-acetylmuramoyl-tripeptide--D-alanyl-D-alanine ligase [Nitrospirota bacterium]